MEFAITPFHSIPLVAYKLLCEGEKIQGQLIVGKVPRQYEWMDNAIWYLTVTWWQDKEIGQFYKHQTYNPIALFTGMLPSSLGPPTSDISHLFLTRHCKTDTKSFIASTKQPIACKNRNSQVLQLRRQQHCLCALYVMLSKKQHAFIILAWYPGARGRGKYRWSSGWITPSKRWSTRLDTCTSLARFNAGLGCLMLRRAEITWQQIS